MSDTSPDGDAPTPGSDAPEHDPGQAAGSNEVVVVDHEGPKPETITEPAKLMRIASMVRELLDETRQASLDEAGRSRLRQIYDRSVGELREVLSPDLQEELASLAPPMEGVPSESEIRVAQAQLVGWLEGLFHGIQAAMFTQQAAARAQFDEIRRRGGLPGKQPGTQEKLPPGQGEPGQYL
ncbi:MAG: proteasome activator [Actinomycetota bacterium]